MTPACETFYLDLGGGTRCSVRVDLAKIAAMSGDDPFMAIEIFWDGPRKPEHWPCYRAWVADTLQRVADVTGKSIALLLGGPDGRSYLLAFQPGCSQEFTIFRFYEPT